MSTRRTPHGRRWRRKFAEAFRGVALTARHESSFRVHIVATVAVVAAAILLECDWLDWCLLAGSVGAVTAAEAFNAALETMFHALDDATKARMTGCLDRAAGGVLLVSAAAAAVGGIVFVRRLAMLV